ncbi:MAG: hypothetical protein IPF83_04000 [Rhodanobacteraceae bacterium]|nr:hypothetical protein [Rhodanobacteraceae bacterium]
MVDHLRADGFRYQPNKAVEWMVCDMVEQPIKVAGGWRRGCVKGGAGERSSTSSCR